MTRTARRLARATRGPKNETWNSRFMKKAEGLVRRRRARSQAIRQVSERSPSNHTGTAAHLSKTYHRLSHFYDRIFTPFLAARIHSTIASLGIPAGARVLDVGVGTGASLRAYPAHCEVVGIDLSEEMLQHARLKIERHQWQHISLHRMDALELKFSDQSFDYVMAFHVAAVVPDCNRLMREITRVCKPGGTIVIINYLRSGSRWSDRLLDLLDPVTHLLGWQTTLRYEDLVTAAPIRVVRRFKTSPSSLFTVIIAEHFANCSDYVSVGDCRASV